MISRQSYVDTPIITREVLLALFADEPPAEIFDIGACEGLDSIRYRRLFPACHVLAFEPLPANVAAIESHLERFGVTAVDVIAAALGESSRRETFHVSGGSPAGRARDPEDWCFGNKSGSLLTPNLRTTRSHWPWLEFVSAIEVDVRTLDEICEERDRWPDFIHIDVQGAELDVFRGGVRALRRARAIWMEVSYVEVYEGQPLAPAVDAFMSEHGFIALAIVPQGAQADVMYVRLDACAPVPPDIVAALERVD